MINKNKLIKLFYFSAILVFIIIWNVPIAKAASEVISTDKDLKTAISDAKSGDTIYVTDMKITQELLFNTTNTKNLNITLASNSSSIVTLDISAAAYPAFAFNFAGLTTVNLTFKNVKIDGGGKGRAIRFSQDGGTLTLNNADFQNCYAGANGGAVHVDWGHATLNDCTFKNNITTGNGGGIFVRCGELIANNCTFSGNKAKFNGGGIYVGGGYEGKIGSGSATIRNCTFDGNEAPSFGGGIETDGEIDIKDSVIKNNIALVGGGMHSDSKSITIANSKIIGNSATIDDATSELYESYNIITGGGGILSMKANITILNSTISDNTSTQNGGGICSTGGNVIINDTEINGNKARKDGGGVWISDLSRLFTNSTNFTNNQAASKYLWTLDKTNDADTHRANILKTTYTSILTNAYNNYDVNYRSDTIYYPVTVNYYLDNVASEKLLKQLSFFAAPGQLTNEIVAMALGNDWINLQGYNSGVLLEELPIITTEPVTINVIYTLEKQRNQNEKNDLPMLPLGPPEVNKPSKLPKLKATPTSSRSPASSGLAKSNQPVKIYEVVDVNGKPIGKWVPSDDNGWTYNEYPEYPNQVPNKKCIPWYYPFALGLLLGPIIWYLYLLLFRRRYITRAEFVDLIVNELQLEEANEDTMIYEDVREDYKYYETIMKAKSSNLLTGFTGKNFKPDIPITREEMASVLAETIRYQNPSINIEYFDLDKIFDDFNRISKVFLSEIELVYSLNIMTKTTDTNFNPQGLSVKREAKKIRDDLLNKFSSSD